MGVLFYFKRRKYTDFGDFESIGNHTKSIKTKLEKSELFSKVFNRIVLCFEQANGMECT